MTLSGGLGGVHRGAEDTFDVSADLRELGRHSIAVVSAGIKSILDIGKTLEYLVSQSAWDVITHYSVFVISTSTNLTPHFALGD